MGKWEGELFSHTRKWLNQNYMNSHWIVTEIQVDRYHKICEIWIKNYKLVWRQTVHESPGEWYRVMHLVYHYVGHEHGFEYIIYLNIEVTILKCQCL